MNKTGYMKGDFALTWGTEITHYVDANGGTNPHRKSISGYVFRVARGVRNKRVASKQGHVDTQYHERHASHPVNTWSE